MIEIVMALLLVAQGSVLEHTYKAKLSDCLKSKRLAMREVNPQTVRFMCKEVEAETNPPNSVLQKRQNKAIRKKLLH